MGFLKKSSKPYKAPLNLNIVELSTPAPLILPKKEFMMFDNLLLKYAIDGRFKMTKISAIKAINIARYINLYAFLSLKRGTNKKMDIQIRALEIEPVKRI